MVVININPEISDIIKRIREIELAEDDVFKLAEKEEENAYQLYLSRFLPESYAEDKGLWPDAYLVDATAIILFHMATKNKILCMAKYDPVTKRLYSPGTFETLALKSFENVAQNNEDISEIYFDVDHFRDVNKEFTHRDATNILRQVGVIIADEIGMPQPPYVHRLAEDTLQSTPNLEEFLVKFIDSQKSPTDFATLITKYQAGRVGGEEFIVLLYGKSLETALEKGEKIRVRVEEELSHVKKGKVQGITISGGVQSLRGVYAFKEVEEMVLKDFDKQAPLLTPKVDVEKHSDAACGIAKDAGRNRIFTFEQAVRELLRLPASSASTFAHNLDLSEAELKIILNKLGYLK